MLRIRPDNKCPISCCNCYCHCRMTVVTMLRVRKKCMTGQCGWLMTVVPEFIFSLYSCSLQYVLATSSCEGMVSAFLSLESGLARDFLRPVNCSRKNGMLIPGLIPGGCAQSHSVSRSFVSSVRQISGRTSGEDHMRQRWGHSRSTKQRTSPSDTSWHFWPTELWAKA